MRFFVKKFERGRFGWTNEEGSKPALTRLINISDYPVSARPLLAEDDDTYFVDDDGFKVEKTVALAGWRGAGGRVGGKGDAAGDAQRDHRRRQRGRRGAAGEGVSSAAAGGAAATGGAKQPSSRSGRALDFVSAGAAGRIGSNGVLHYYVATCASSLRRAFATRILQINILYTSTTHNNPSYSNGRTR